MESFNFSKGYAVLGSPSENQQPSASTRRRRIMWAASFLIILTLVIAASIGSLIIEKRTEPSEEGEEEGRSGSVQTDTTESLKTVCSVTEHLESCVNTISPLNEPPKSDPVHFFNLSLQVTIQELANLTSLPKTLISKSNDAKESSALKDCGELFDDALSQVNRSAELMKGGRPGKKLLTEMKMSDMQTWISAAMTDQETCLDGLDEVGSTVVNEVRERVHMSSEYMSISLAILNNLGNLVQKFGLSMP